MRYSIYRLIQTQLAPAPVSCWEADLAKWRKYMPKPEDYRTLLQGHLDDKAESWETGEVLCYLERSFNRFDIAVIDEEPLHAGDIIVLRPELTLPETAWAYYATPTGWRYLPNFTVEE